MTDVKVFLPDLFADLGVSFRHEKINLVFFVLVDEIFDERRVFEGSWVVFEVSDGEGRFMVIIGKLDFIVFQKSFDVLRGFKKLFLHFINYFEH